MRKRHLGMMGLALAMAGSISGAQALQSTQSDATQTTQQDIKGTPPKQREKKTKFIKEVGGIPLMQTGVFGLTPREYGLRYGTGASRKRKNNFLRLAHNSKVSKRINRA